MNDRRYSGRPTPERRSQWRDKPIVLPIVVLLIALWPAKPVTVVEVGQSVTVEHKGSMTYVWFPEEGLERFTVTHTTERR